MDGMVNTETDRYGLRLFPISDIYVREVQTVSNSFAPEFGGTSGIIYNVITNSGANQSHAEFSFIGRPTDASARPYDHPHLTPGPLLRGPISRSRRHPRCVGHGSHRGPRRHGRP